MIRRIYTNWLPIEMSDPDEPLEIEITNDGVRVVVERRAVSKDDNDEIVVDKVIERRELPASAFDEEIAKISPRFAMDFDGELAWVGGRISSDLIRTGVFACETTDDAEAPMRGETDAELDVLADWRMSHADPQVRARGELWNLPTGDERARQLLAKYTDRWVSGLLPYAAIGFRRGYIDTVRLARNDATTTDDELAAFLRLPIASRLRRLELGEVGPMSFDNGLRPYNENLVEAIGASGSPLRELELVGGNLESCNALGKLPKLERLVVRDNELLDFEGFSSASLRDLELHEVDVDFDALLDTPIRRLTCRLGTPVARMLIAIVDSALLARLEELVIGGMDPAGSRAFIDDNADRFQHLKRLVVEGL